MRKLEEQVQMNEYIANDKLPSEFGILKEEVEMLQRLADGPPLTQENVEELRNEVLTERYISIFLLIQVIILI